VLARASEQGVRALARRLPRSVRASIDDSKRLVSHGDVRIGEAWARVLAAPDAASPSELFERLSLEGTAKLREPCPREAERMCWDHTGEAFEADPKLLVQVARHRSALAQRGIEILAVRSSVVCTEQLNRGKRSGKNRFVMDLHAMEALVLALRKVAAADVSAVCGKVGGIGEYSRYFGPLGGWLHAILDEGQAKSAYRFPGLGELAFVRDADASDPLVMLASLVGKYVRELLMSRIGRHFLADPEAPRPSGYHDPVTARFVRKSALLRKKRKVPDLCFEREREPEVAAESSA